MYTLEEIIRLREDRNLIFGSGKILFLTREIKFISLSDGVSFFCYINHTTVREKARKTPSISSFERMRKSRMKFRMNFTSGVFSR